MPRKLIKRFMPKPEKIQANKSLGFMSAHLADPSLWTLTRTSVSGAFSIGLFVAFLPIPMQMLLAAFLAGYWRVNLPISVGLVWVSNPLTTPPLLYVCYRLGAWILNVPLSPPSSEGIIDWVFTHFNQIWPPLLLGCLIIGAVLAVVANVAVRLLWRWQVSQSWNKRQSNRLLPSTQKKDTPEN
ncbi:DUF2062 domain-containing protein [Marinospirillum insulare]|uniref:DUF2062 domain-containing protein n=1 Tax=Marinospirillum insulare TaxID=217169 RepID=A0ABQ5ZYX2_9GAMM|nr:DUF2062 domain-containing protein [Marinospirillum insulare]GLR64691.1 hypothetical protein GCM10007878_21290 [Marinospirillum insulare]